MAPAHDPVRRLVERFYAEVWNQWDVAAAREVLHPRLTFRGSLGRRTRGVEEFLEYVTHVRAAFPDFHNELNDLVVEGGRAAARLTYTGTHLGEVLGVAATGRRIRYDGLAWFVIDGDRIVDGHVLGDVDALRDQLGDG